MHEEVTLGPAPRPPVAPAAAAWLSVVFAVAPSATFPELSTARYRTVVLPSCVISAVAVAEGPGVPTGTSM